VTGAAVAARSGASAKAPHDQTTILVKWSKWAPGPAATVGELKTKVKIVKVPRAWTVDQTLDFYRSLPNVVYAEPNYLADQDGLAAPDDTFFGAQWGLAKIDALAGWGVYPGSFAAAGAPIAFVDSGIDASHPDLAGQVGTGANCVTGVCVAGGVTLDDNGHGTVNAGAAAAAANNGIGVAGVAPGTHLIPVKALGPGGTGTYAAIAAGIIWAADDGAKVINLSLAGTAPSQTLCGAVSYALDKGVFVDAAAGNFGSAAPVYPAACPGVAGVAATDQNDATPSWSDTGPNVFVAAPGVSVHATYPGNLYALATGTSVSTALVSGLASLLLGQDPSRNPADVRRILATTSDKVGVAQYGADPYSTCAGCTWSTTDGYGRIDVLRALSAGTAPVAPPPAPPASPADFTIAATSGSASTPQGGSASYTFSIAGQNGFDGSVSLAVSGLPAGATAAFAPTSVPASGSSTLTVSTAGETPAGSTTITVHATSGSIEHTVTVGLTVTAVQAAPGPALVDFALSAVPGARIVKLGRSAVVTVKATGTRGPVDGVDLVASGLPAGVTATFVRVSPGVWTLQLDAALSAPRFVTATITITGTRGAVVRTTTVVVTVM